MANRALVDDEEAVRRALKRLMVSSGITVEAFASGAEFLDSLAPHRRDCLVLDLQMPDLSGFDVQARLAQSDAGVVTFAPSLVAGPPPAARLRIRTRGGSACGEIRPSC